MTDDVLRRLGHLEAAETMLATAGDGASLSRLALVIHLLRRRHGLPDRPLQIDLIN